MELKKRINTVLNKQLSRQDFIKHIAIGAVAVVGGGAVVRAAATKSAGVDTGTNLGTAYGDTAYGGSQERMRGRS